VVSISEHRKVIIWRSHGEGIINVMPFYFEPKISLPTDDHTYNYANGGFHQLEYESFLPITKITLILIGYSSITVLIHFK
jgi:hypothetical protein